MRIVTPDKPRRGLSPERIARAVAYSRAGHTAKAIAWVMRCSADHVSRVLKQAREEKFASS